MKIILVIFIFLSFIQIQAKKAKPLFDSKKIFNVSYMDSMEKCKSNFDSLKINYKVTTQKIPNSNDINEYPALYIDEMNYNGYETNFHLIFKEGKLDFIGFRIFEKENSKPGTFAKLIKKEIAKWGGKCSYNNIRRDLINFDNAFISYDCDDNYGVLELNIFLTELGNME